MANALCVYKPLFGTRRWLTAAVLLATVGAFSTTDLQASEPRVQFDVPAIVPFDREPSDTSWETRIAADRQLIEIQLDVSSWLVSGKPQEIDELLFEVVELSGQGRVVDFQPRDEKTSDYVGNIAVQKSTERNRSLGIDASSTFDWVAQGSAHAAISNKTTESTRYEMKPPQQQIVVSGTTRQGHGVSFRFRQSIDSPLEGTQRLIIRLSVPPGWTTSLLRVDCAATGTSRGTVPGFKQSGVVGRQRFIIPVFDRLDPVAMQISERYQSIAGHLRSLATRQQDQIRRREVSDPFQRVGVLLSVAERDIPREWLELLLEQGDAQAFEGFADRLPDDVRQAGLDFLATRRNLLTQSR